jgi:hypothetical protein
VKSIGLPGRARKSTTSAIWKEVDRGVHRAHPIDTARTDCDIGTHLSTGREESHAVTRPVSRCRADLAPSSELVPLNSNGRRIDPERGSDFDDGDGSGNRHLHARRIELQEHPDRLRHRYVGRPIVGFRGLKPCSSGVVFEQECVDHACLAPDIFQSSLVPSMPGDLRSPLPEPGLVVSRYSLRASRRALVFAEVSAGGQCRCSAHAPPA